MQPLTCKKLMDSKKFQLMSVCSCRAGHGSIHFGNVPGIRQLYTHLSELSSFDLTLSQTSPCFHLSAIMSIEKIEGKGEIALTSNFSFSQSVFFTFWKYSLPSSSNSKLLSANSFNLEESKICCLGKV